MNGGSSGFEAERDLAAMFAVGCPLEIIEMYRRMWWLEREPMMLARDGFMPRCYGPALADRTLAESATS